MTPNNSDREDHTSDSTTNVTLVVQDTIGSATLIHQVGRLGTGRNGWWKQPIPKITSTLIEVFGHHAALHKITGRWRWKQTTLKKNKKHTYWSFWPPHSTAAKQDQDTGRNGREGPKTPRHHYQMSNKCTTPHSEVIEKHGGEGPKTPRHYHQNSKKCTTPHSEVYYEECNCWHHNIACLCLLFFGLFLISYLEATLDSSIDQWAALFDHW